MLVVSNTSAILNLAIIDRLSLIREQFTTIIIPKGVLEELRVGENLPGSKNILEALDVKWLQVEEVQDSAILRILKRELDAGEAEAIGKSYRTGVEFTCDSGAYSSGAVKYCRKTKKPEHPTSMESPASPFPLSKFRRLPASQLPRFYPFSFYFLPFTFSLSPLTIGPYPFSFPFAFSLITFNLFPLSFSYLYMYRDQ